jgi:hypothetical protein
MPTLEQQEENKNAVHEKYKLPNVIAGVDGCHFPFMEKPRGIPAGRNPVAYINRESFCSLFNCELTLFFCTTRRTLLLKLTKNKQLLIRKGFKSINAQIVGGIDRRIYDINLGAPGSFHDAAVYQLSPVKAWLETRFPRR